ncbi:MAG: flotillin family protein [Myxococcota bacterium]
MNLIIVTLTASILLMVIIGGMVVLLWRCLYIAGPDEILVFSGRGSVLPDGRQLGYRLIQGGGRGVRIPLLDQVQRMSLAPIPVEVALLKVLARNGETISLHANATVGVSRDPVRIHHAIERFLSHPENIHEAARQCLSAAFRDVIAASTLEEIRQDRERFISLVEVSAADDLDRMGLIVDTLDIRGP